MYIQSDDTDTFHEYEIHYYLSRIWKEIINSCLIGS